jgi:hypothetical protein
LDFPASFLFIKKQLSADNREFAARGKFCAKRYADRATDDKFNPRYIKIPKSRSLYNFLCG